MDYLIEKIAQFLMNEKCQAVLCEKRMEFIDEMGNVFIWISWREFKEEIYQAIVFLNFMEKG